MSRGEEKGKWWRRLVPRISLLSFLLLSTLICVAVSHYRLMQENKVLNQRNDDLVREIGYLIVDDRNKIYVRQLESFEELITPLPGNRLLACLFRSAPKISFLEPFIGRTLVA